MGADLETFQIFHSANRFLRRVKQVRSVGMKIEYLHLVHLFGPKFLIARIDQLASLGAAFVTEGQVNSLREGKSASRTAKKAHSYIGYALNDTVIGLGWGGKGGARIIIDPYPSICPFFHFSPPLFSHDADIMESRQKIGEFKRDGLLLGCYSVGKRCTE